MYERGVKTKAVKPADQCMMMRLNSEVRGLDMPFSVF